jgi:hypothetical protein
MRSPSQPELPDARRPKQIHSVPDVNPTRSAMLPASKLTEKHVCLEYPYACGEVE